MEIYNAQFRRESNQFVPSTPPNSVTIHVEGVPIIYFQSAFKDELGRSLSLDQMREKIYSGYFYNERR